MDHLINQWHCDEEDCNGVFYTDLETKPESCPYCNSEELSDSKVYKVKPII
ncbi:hypothetical protein vBBak6_052 [Bacillus phage v_B-Bak6]|uniref:Uncharacterized protein n=1 Tax=Bacillus phage Basilisk TaxID=1296654 RepID=S5MA31_9CAUD|nr:hypothetical protein PP653_gp107 [Bacillus phage Basilisk]AGR46604.1 hypothetical protein BASILISK_60 [Bacillus phage Basilisk]AXY83012.1 hypothetical protein vBBak1_052 [Bacillus phage v_B-Bak1]AXY83132.1 hypothetical protein vBBak6_052 [Bacillus phage v_B-Bak6]